VTVASDALPGEVTVASDTMSQEVAVASDTVPQEVAVASDTMPDSSSVRGQLNPEDGGTAHCRFTSRHGVTSQDTWMPSEWKFYHNGQVLVTRCDVFLRIMQPPHDMLLSVPHSDISVNMC
jgi:hypothetical protein